MSTGNAPKDYKGVIISSTFDDLKEHRAALSDALQKQDLFPIDMCTHIPEPGDNVIDSSLGMVRKSCALILLISFKYGGIHPCEKRNPDNLSITHLEFLEAQKQGLPVLVFLMGNKHDIKPNQMDLEPAKIQSLAAFKELAKKDRVYHEFNSLEEFREQAIHSVSKLNTLINSSAEASANDKNSNEASKSTSDTQNIGIPRPPELYAAPPYIGSHEFVGRAAQLEKLNDWASKLDSRAVLLFEAIGGTGKSMLTWHWLNHYAKQTRPDWAGMFWYSFYEQGANMADFCAKALAYVSGKPFKELRALKTAEMTEELLGYSSEKPWLVVCDGLERILVSYQRYDASSMLDEEAGERDEIASRDPCSAIRIEDDELLYSFAGLQKSKILVTSRLTPKVLINSSDKPIPGVYREFLPGLRPADAENLFRACGITGNAITIREYLQSHCDCHPLVIGVLAGLINHYRPDKGNFDAWVEDLEGGKQINWQELDLIQKRTHILQWAIKSLDADAEELLSTMALMHDAVDYQLLTELNAAGGEIALLKNDRARLDRALDDLENRALVQYDKTSKKYDLHPVVRGYASGRLTKEVKSKLGQPLIDHFSQQSHMDYESIKSLDDISTELNLVRTLLKIGEYDEAFFHYREDLYFNLRYVLLSPHETLKIIKAFFPKGFKNPPVRFNSQHRSAVLFSVLGVTMEDIGEYNLGYLAHEFTVANFFKALHISDVAITISNMVENLQNQNKFRLSHKLNEEVLRKIAKHANYYSDKIIKIRETECNFLVHMSQGDSIQAREMFWKLKQIIKSGFHDQDYFPPGRLENYEIRLLKLESKLTLAAIEKAFAKANKDNNMLFKTMCLQIKLEYLLECDNHGAAYEVASELIRYKHRCGMPVNNERIAITIYQALSDNSTDHQDEIERLVERRLEKYVIRHIAKFYHQQNQQHLARKHALKHFWLAVADGEPFVDRYELNKSIELLKEIDVEIPDIPVYDASKEVPFSWQKDFDEMIEKMKADAET